MCRVALRRALVHPMPVDESGTAEQTEGTRKVYQRALLNGLGVRCRMSVCVCTELEELRVNSVASHCASRVHMARSRMLTKWFSFEIAKSNSAKKVQSPFVRVESDLHLYGFPRVDYLQRSVCNNATVVIEVL
jgi:hypothetical protein